MAGDERRPHGDQRSLGLVEVDALRAAKALTRAVAARAWIPVLVCDSAVVWSAYSGVGRRSGDSGLPAGTAKACVRFPRLAHVVSAIMCCANRGSSSQLTGSPWRSRRSMSKGAVMCRDQG